MELDDGGVAIERGLNDAPLHARAASVHEAHVAKTGQDGRVDVLADYRRDVARRECMEVELGFDRNADGIVGSSQSGSQLSALSSQLVSLTADADR